MGLAGPKNKTKISQDPNNTQWAKSTTGFGHRMLSSQGWTPGSTLGAKNATHKAHFSQASHSHIRVVLRDDNLGIGAQKGRADTDVFGLDLYQGLLGRLNGKTQEQLEKEGKIRKDVLLGSVGRERYGNGMFVRGGFLVGDKIEDVVSVEEAQRLLEVRLAHEARVEAAKNGGVEKRSEKRKRDGEEGVDLKAEKKNKKRKSIVEVEETDEKSAKKAKKDKKRKSEVTSTTADSTIQNTVTPEKAEKKRLKAEKRARKEARRIRREQKALKKASSSNSSDSSPEPPSAAQAAAQKALSARFATRQRYIQQKRMATMDPTALNEIFMIKSQS
ncbi:putative g-patch rna maturation protein [Venturia nashicola]|uniref:PinX1-related protein 1 n=1 Tax=Venturia nashicola TaxID=86259 RepID=A0A4Z1PCW3_9PEZI|nr:putative g-patch rna maturation protein [Venturia nashicola]TLD39133.1 putative g-patch rna maturation protein [Venturia nashicola]